jgi:hypothetical protein
MMEIKIHKDINQQGMGWTIWKYNLPRKDATTLSIPEVRQPLCVKMQDNMITVWYMVDPNAEKVNVKHAVVGTGWDIGQEFPYDYTDFIGTVKDGSFIWHIFCESF